MRGVAKPLEAVHLEAQQRVGRPELIRDEDAAARPRDARQLGDGELRPANVMQDSVAAAEIELRIAERQRHDVALEQPHVRGSRRTAGLEVLGVGVDADDLGHEGREREGQGARPAARVERDLVARERREEVTHALGEVGRPLLLQRQPQLETHAPSVAASERARSSASSRVEIVPAARSSSMASRIRPTAGPGSIPSSSPRRRGSLGSERLAASTTPASSGAPTYASASSAQGSVSRLNRWIERGEESSGLRARRRAAAYRFSSFEIGSRDRLGPNTTTSRKFRSSRASSRGSSAPPSGSSRPTSSSRRKPPAESRASSASVRSPAGFVTTETDARRSACVCASMRKPSSSSKRTARRSRTGSSTKTASETARTTPARRSTPPPWGSWTAPVATCSAIALKVK